MSSARHDTDYILNITENIYYTVSIVSIVCGLLTVYIIRSMNAWNGYVLLVYALAIVHVLYNLTSFLDFATDVSPCLQRTIRGASGTGVCLWINTMSAIIFYTVMYQVSFRVKPYFAKIALVILWCSGTIGLIEGIVCGIDSSYQSIYWAYFTVRFASMIINALVYIVVTITLNLPYQSKWCGWTLSDFAMRRKTNELIIVLVTRLRYYPVVQIFTGACSMWWDLEFGFYPSTLNSDLNTKQVVCLCLYSITNPLAGIGYFLIFLYVQPSAYKFLCMKVRHLFCFCYGGSNDNKDSNGHAQRHDRSSEIDTDGLKNASMFLSESECDTVNNSESIPSSSKAHQQIINSAMNSATSSSSTKSPRPLQIRMSNHNASKNKGNHHYDDDYVDDDVDGDGGSFDVDHYNETLAAATAAAARGKGSSSASASSSYLFQSNSRHQNNDINNATSRQSRSDTVSRGSDAGGWMRWHSRTSSSNNQNDINPGNRGSTQLPHLSRTSNMSYDMDGDTIPIFVLEDDMNEDLILDELQRRISQHHLRSSTTLRTSTATNTINNPISNPNRSHDSSSNDSNNSNNTRETTNNVFHAVDV